MEVLLKAGADVKAVDGLGHDVFHYARLNKNPELVALVKSYFDKATRGKATEHSIIFKMFIWLEGGTLLQ